MRNLGLIEQWKKGKNALQKQAKLFFKDKKNLKYSEERSKVLHHQVFTEINCLDCANCCKSIPPMVNAEDAKRISKHLGIGIGQFYVSYIAHDSDGDAVMNSSPCPFLAADNACTIYEVRPKACKDYPHTHQGLKKHLSTHQQNIAYCPAVFHMVKRMMDGINASKST